MGGFDEAPVPPTVTRDLRVVVKSYIAPIGGRTGSPYCGGVLNPLADVKLRALALATDAAMSENPLTDAKDKRYRLYSARTFTVTCNGGRIASVAPSPIDADTGTECIPRTSTCLQPPPLIVYGVTAGMNEPHDIPVLLDGEGEAPSRRGTRFPDGLSADLRLHLAQRQRADRMRGRRAARCDPPHRQPVPGHRVFVNGVIQPPTVPQGTYKNLWVPAGVFGSDARAVNGPPLPPELMNSVNRSRLQPNLRRRTILCISMIENSTFSRRAGGDPRGETLPEPWKNFVARALDVLKRQQQIGIRLSSDQTRRLACLLQGTLVPSFDDRFVNFWDLNAFQRWGRGSEPAWDMILQKTTTFLDTSRQPTADDRSASGRSS